MFALGVPLKSAAVMKRAATRTRKRPSLSYFHRAAFKFHPRRFRVVLSDYLFILHLLTGASDFISLRAGVQAIAGAVI